MNQKGFAPIILIIVVIGISLLGGGAYYYSKTQVTPAQNKAVEPPSPPPVSENTPPPKVQPPPPASPKPVSPTPPSSAKISLEKTLEYKYYDKSIPFTFKYPKDYCWTQDIASVVVYTPSFCGKNNASNVKGNGLLIFVFPEENIKTTDEYIDLLKAERSKNIQKTDERRTIGGYQAVKLLDSKDSTVLTYAFLTDIEFTYPEDPIWGQMSGQNSHNKYGIVIQSTLHTEPGGKEAEDLILSTLTFH
ncbi:MAG: hypothetical protein AAB482_04670 [Patescibacteria group bacterium]